MELTPNEERWISPKHIQDILSVSKTKAHEVVHQIAHEDKDPEAVIMVGRCLRVSKEALRRFIRRHQYRKD